MGCGCNKNKGVSTAVTAAMASGQTVARPAPAQVLFDVFDADQNLVASFSNPATARGEARRTGGEVRPRKADPITAPTSPDSHPASAN